MEDKLESDDYEALVNWLGPQLGALLAKAKEGMCSPPLEVLVTGADDDTVAHFELNPADKSYKNYLGKDHVLTAKFPVTITVTDKNGKTWDGTFDKGEQTVVQ